MVRDERREELSFVGVRMISVLAEDSFKECKLISMLQFLDTNLSESCCTSLRRIHIWLKKFFQKTRVRPEDDKQAFLSKEPTSP